MIKFSNVNFSYNESKEFVLNNINLEINDGECVLISGKSGCGKSTLLMLINGIIPEYVNGNLTGNVIVNGLETKKNSIQKLSQKVGSVFQNPKSQFFHLNTTDELLFSSSNQGVEREQMKKRLSNTINLFKIQKLVNRNIFELSGGEKQKIACASVYTGRPTIFVFDEPSANLDWDSIVELAKIIKKIKAEGHTVVIAEHRLYYLMDICDRVLYMKNGEVEKDYSISEFKNMSRDKQKEKGIRSLTSVKLERPPINNLQAKCILQLKNLMYIKKRKEILNIPSMNIQSGKVVAIIGKNGAGKTTFANCLCGINKCKGIFVKGKELNEKRRNKEFNMVMQDVNHQLFTESVLDEFFINSDKNNTEELKKANKLLKKLNLLDFAECHPLSLSGGQKQRLVIGVSIFECKEYIIFDEPTSGLDYEHMVSVANLIRELQKAAKVILIITHDIEFINMCCDSYIKIENGTAV